MFDVKMICLLEDGGKPTDTTAFDFLIRVMQNEPDAKVKRFAELTLKKIGLESRERQEDAKLWLAARPALRQRGKCDFCSAANVLVEVERDTLIPVAGAMPRCALICDDCVKTS